MVFFSFLLPTILFDEASLACVHFSACSLNSHKIGIPSMNTMSVINDFQLYSAVFAKVDKRIQIERFNLQMMAKSLVYITELNREITDLQEICMEVEDDLVWNKR